MVLCGRHFEKLDAIIKEHKVVQIWITHSLRHEYSQRQSDWKGTRVGESRFETEYFVPGFSFLPLSFPGQSGSTETWQESTIMGYFTLFHSPLLTSNPSAVAVWRKGLQFIKPQFRDMLYLCHIKHERGVHTDIQQQSLLLKHCLCCISTENIEYDKEA